MRTLTALFFCLLMLLPAGCREVERVAERKVNDILPGYVGPADKYSTRVRGNPDALRRGRMRSVHVDGVNVRLTEDLTADALRLDLENVDVDTGTKRLRSVERVTFLAMLGEASLNRYIKARRPEIRDLRVELGAADATVHATPEILGVALTPIAVKGTVTPRDGGSLLDFTPGSGRVAVVPVPAALLAYLAQNLNPVVDLSTLRIPIRVEKSEIKDRAVYLTGTIDPADLIRASATASASGSE